MARANRHHIPGQVWHITHRCHKKEFLLKFARDRRRSLSWLFEAKKRFGLKILNYVVTSNHIHLLVVDNGPDVIPKSLAADRRENRPRVQSAQGTKGSLLGTGLAWSDPIQNYTFQRRNTYADWNHRIWKHWRYARAPPH